MCFSPCFFFVALMIASVGSDNKSTQDRRKAKENDVRSLRIGPLMYALPLSRPSEKRPVYF